MCKKYRFLASIAALISIGLWQSVAIAHPVATTFKGTILEFLLQRDGAQALVAAIQAGDEAGCLLDIEQRLDDKKAQLVVFAPTNSSFEKFFRLTPNTLAGRRIDEIKAQLQELLNSLELTEADLCSLLLNHVAEVDSKPQDSTADELLAGGSISVASGKTFPVSVGMGGVVVNHETHIERESLTRNGIVHYVEDVIQDPPPAPPPGTEGKVTVFVTAFWGFGNNIDGLAGADAICQNEAERAGLPGTWTAWLSDSATNAVDRIPDGEYLDVAGTLIAEDKNDLTDGRLKAPINLRADGVETNPAVWTGTNPDGTADSADPDDFCVDWTSSNQKSTLGLSNKTSPQWTNLGSPQNCSNQGSLYCFGSGQ